MGFIELTTVNGTQMLFNVCQIVAVRKSPNVTMVDAANDDVWKVTEPYEHVRDAICAAGCVVVGAKGGGE